MQPSPFEKPPESTPSPPPSIEVIKNSYGEIPKNQPNSEDEDSQLTDNGRLAVVAVCSMFSVFAAGLLIGTSSAYINYKDELDFDIFESNPTGIILLVLSMVMFISSQIWMCSKR